MLSKVGLIAGYCFKRKKPAFFWQYYVTYDALKCFYWSPHFCGVAAFQLLVRAIRKAA